MRPRQQVSVLREIAAIRAAQTLARKSAALLADKFADVCAGRREAEATRLDELDAGWRQALSGGAFGDGRAQIWASAIRGQAGLVREVETRLDQARALRNAASQGWQVAAALKRVADDRTVQGSRQLVEQIRMRREQELIDQYLTARSSR